MIYSLINTKNKKLYLLDNICHYSWLIMRLYEYQAKDILSRYGIKTPKGVVTDTAEKIEFDEAPSVVKAQVLVGGRGKAGGIKFADNNGEIKKTVQYLLFTSIKGERVKKVLVEERLDIDHEFYLGITLDRDKKMPVALASAYGGMDIEDVAINNSQSIIKRYIDPLFGLWDFNARKIAKDIGIKGNDLIEVTSVLSALYNIFKEYDTELVEINPFVRTVDGRFLAADAKILIDDNSLFRHREFDEQVKMQYNNLELMAKMKNIAYVGLDGDIGIIGNGAGLVMATIDTVNLYGGSPANFCDLGGGASKDRVIDAIDIVLSNKNVKGIFINIMGGITRCDEIAKGITEYKNTKRIDIPFVIRMVGTKDDEGRKICESNGIPVISTMDEAAKAIVRLVRDNTYN